MLKEEEEEEERVALNGIVHTRQTLSESILLWALIRFFMYVSLLGEVNYCAEKFGAAEQKRFGPTDKGPRRTQDARL